MHVAQPRRKVDCGLQCVATRMRAPSFVASFVLVAQGNHRHIRADLSIFPPTTLATELINTGTLRKRISDSTCQFASKDNCLTRSASHLLHALVVHAIEFMLYTGGGS
jgi:hypothetical protein